MVLTLHGNIHSTCTSRVRTVLEELNVPYEFVGIDFAKGEHKAPAFVAVQPFGQVPYLDDDGFKVYESRAIARYIAIKFGGVGKLIPAQSDAQKTALFEQAASIETANFDPSASGLAFENIFKVYVVFRSKSWRDLMLIAMVAYAGCTAARLTPRPWSASRALLRRSSPRTMSSSARRSSLLAM